MRRAGAGRPSLATSDPTVVEDLERLVCPATRGDPERPLRWTSKSAAKLADGLRGLGHEIVDRSVLRLLGRIGYTMQANVKTREGAEHPDRDAVDAAVEDHLRAVELEPRAQQRASEQRERKTGGTKRERSPRDDADAEHRAQAREFTRRAHAVNLDLGAALLDRLATVDPASMDVARFLAYGLLGPESAHYLGTGDHVARTIAANGIRLVLDDQRTTTTPTLKSGQPGKTTVSYGEPEDALKWLWKFVDGAKTAGELYGRALVVFACEHYANQLALPTSQRRGSVLPRSRRDTARKAFEKLTKTALPGSHRELARAIEREARSYRDRVAAIEQNARAAAATDDVGEEPDVEPVDDVDGQLENEDDLEEQQAA